MTELDIVDIYHTTLRRVIYEVVDVSMPITYPSHGFFMTRQDALQYIERQRRGDADEKQNGQNHGLDLPQ